MDSHSLAERARREKINARMKVLQRRTTAPKRSVKPTKTLSLTSPPQTITTPSTTDADCSSSLRPKKVLVPIGFGTEEMEAVIIVDVLHRATVNVTAASVEPQLEVEAYGSIKLVADTTIAACSNQIFDLVALSGGMPGSARLRDCEILKKITSKHAKENRLYGAICAAPAVTLLPLGLLRRKQMTCHPAFSEDEGYIKTRWRAHDANVFGFALLVMKEHTHLLIILKSANTKLPGNAIQKS